MAPEHEARARVLYDHESEETGRRRRAVADWGVGEDIFDRMPSRRFTRAERRAAHSGTIVIARDEEPRPDHLEVAPGDEPWAKPQPVGRVEPDASEWDREPAPAPRRVRAVESWLDEVPGSRRFASDADVAEQRHYVAEARRHAPEAGAAEQRRFAPEPTADEPRRERAVESWLDAEPAQPELALAEPPARLVAASARPEPAPVRTVVVQSDEPRERRTVVISGHPGGLPMARPARPPKTAIERVGTRPDRIVAYAVALGFLLVLIAVLTTGQ